MHTVPEMFKRILILGAGGVLGLVLTVGVARVSQAWSLFPNRDLNRSAEYVREILQMVNQNYVDASSVSYDKLAKTTLLHGSPDIVIRRIEQLRSLGVTSIMVHYPPYYGPERTLAMLRLFA